jgi:hypothetical protein
MSLKIESAKELLVRSRAVIGTTAKNGALLYQEKTPGNHISGSAIGDPSKSDSFGRLTEYVRPVVPTPHTQSIEGYSGVRAMFTSSRRLQMSGQEESSHELRVGLKVAADESSFDPELVINNQGDARYSALSGVVNRLDEDDEYSDTNAIRVVGLTAAGLLVARAAVAVVESDGIDISTRPLDEVIEAVQQITPLTEIPLQPGIPALIPQRFRS